LDKLEHKGGKNMRNENVADFGLLRLPDVLKLYPVSRSTFLAKIKEGRFPQGVLLSKRCRAWKVADIKALCEGAAAR
jgi:prophage regulatory protein